MSMGSQCLHSVASGHIPHPDRAHSVPCQGGRMGIESGMMAVKIDEELVDVVEED